MKKFLCALLALGMAFVAVACGGKGGDDGATQSYPQAENSSTQSDFSEENSSTAEADSSVLEDGSSDNEEDGFVPDSTSATELVEYFRGKTGTVTYCAGRDLTIESLAQDAPIYLGDNSVDNVFTIDGGEAFGRTKTVTVVGNGGGVVEANGGVLVFKNLTIRNQTHGFEGNYYRPYYAEFGGKVRFENCTLACAVQLRNDAEAEFINCDVVSGVSDEYGVWIADGSAKFDNCKFTGHRALKVHEIAGMDVVNVAVENSFFEKLSVKPAIAIDIAQEMSTTTIAFKNCDIYDCASYANDAVEGVDGFYESDQATTSFHFTATECYLNGAFFSFADGEITWLDEF